MTTWKKAGVTALAGSMVAFSAQAVDVSITGSMKMAYTADTGKNDSQADGNRFGLSKAVQLAGSGEMDNGWIVSLTNSAIMGSAHSISVDMGDVGKITFQQTSGGLGIGKIDDMTPSADEEVWNGLTTSTATETVTGKVSGGNNGFQYDNSFGGVSVGIGYQPKGDAAQGDGVNGGTGSKSSVSYTVKFSPMDGLNVGAGVGDIGDATGQDDHSTIYATYAMGSFTVGAQQSEVDYHDSANDEESKAMSISFAVNDNLSISYGKWDTDQTGATYDEKISGISVGYSMGGMTIKGHRNKGEHLGNSTNGESEHTEIALSWAF